MTFSEAVDKVIALGREVREYYEAELPKSYRNYPLVGSDETGPPAPPAEKKLRAFLASLSDEMIYQLVLLMHLGRMDFGVDDLADQYRYLKGDFRNSKSAVSSMMEEAPLAADLADGLAELRKHNIDVNKMPLKKVKLRKLS